MKRLTKLGCPWLVALLCSCQMALATTASNRIGSIISKLSWRGGSSSLEAGVGDANPSSSSVIRVAYQGEPGAYSEKATRELLGPNVFAIGRPSFEAAFRAVASMEVDYACLPIENSLGGSIHENYDLMLRYQL